MKYCTHCGKELLDEAVICMDCGCEVQEEKAEICDNVVIGEETVAEHEQPKSQTAPKPKINKKVILIAVVSVAVLVMGLFLWNFIRVEQVKEDLAGRTFSYLDFTYRLVRKEFAFDDDAQCEYTYYYSSVMDEAESYSLSYKIKFKDGMIFLVRGSHTYEIQYDKYGRIDALYDFIFDELYD